MDGIFVSGICCVYEIWPPISSIWSRISLHEWILESYACPNSLVPTTLCMVGKLESKSILDMHCQTCPKSLDFACIASSAASTCIFHIFQMTAWMASLSLASFAYSTCIADIWSCISLHELLLESYACPKSYALLDSLVPTMLCMSRKLEPKIILDMHCTMIKTTMTLMEKDASSGVAMQITKLWLEHPSIRGSVLSTSGSIRCNHQLAIIVPLQQLCTKPCQSMNSAKWCL